VNFSALLSRFSTICLTFCRSLLIGGSDAHAAPDRQVRPLDDRLELRHHLGTSSLRPNSSAQRHPPRLDARDVEDVVDERQQVARVRVDPRQALALRVGDRPLTPCSSMCV
jgi:hypothetical protein